MADLLNLAPGAARASRSVHLSTAVPPSIANSVVEIASIHVATVMAARMPRPAEVWAAFGLFLFSGVHALAQVVKVSGTDDPE
jgi:hypothetical protein